MRLDQFVLEKNPQLSRSYAARLIETGKVLVNSEPKKPGYRLRETDKVKMNFDLSELEQIPEIDLPVLYEDKDTLVVNKPVGVISHSRSRFWNEPSVASFVRQRTGQEGERAGIVHRLDRATSGVMICAKNSTALKWLQKQFSSRKVIKTYQAIVRGQLPETEALIDMPIERNPKAPATFRVGPGGRSAQTKYRVILTSAKYSLLELQPLTGRTHQIRVHLAKIGHPILGDTLYHGDAADRLFLHAVSLKLSLPGGKVSTFKAPLPTEFAQVMEA